MTPEELEKLADTLLEALEEGDMVRIRELNMSLTHAEIAALEEIFRRREEQDRRRTEQG
jgi:hypothetical protein